MLVFIIIIALLLVIDLIIVNLISRYFCDRKCPSLPALFTQKMIFGKVTKRSGKKSKSKARANELEEMGLPIHTIKTDAGDELVAHYYPCENAKRIVIACHGWRSSWSYDFNAQAGFLHDNNCSILFIEQRGHGKSGGRYIYHGKMERYDIAKWSHYVEENIDSNLPIYLYGMSMGAAACLMALGSGVSKNVKGVIADSASSNVKYIARQAIKNLNLPLFVFYPQVALDQYLRIKMKADAYTAEEALENNDVPALIIHGKADAVADISVAISLYEKSAPNSKLLLVDNANHMKSYFVDKKAYEEAMLEFFDI